MSKIAATARRSPGLAARKPDELDYAKYENINVSKKRALLSRPASETRVSIRTDSNKERRSKTPTLNGHDREIERDFDSKPDKSAQKIFIKHPGSSSSRKYEESSKKLVQFRKCKTDLKILPDKQRPQTVQGLHIQSDRQRPQTVQGIARKSDSIGKTKHTSNELHVPLKEVRRKLRFDYVDNDDADCPEAAGLDFTDKLAAIKNVIVKSRETRDILDRRAYYNEYNSSQKRIMVSRSDSLKENNDVGDGDTYIVEGNRNNNGIKSEETHKVTVGTKSELDKEVRSRNKGSQEVRRRTNSSERKNRAAEYRVRDVRSADIFKSRNEDAGRLSVDIDKLRNNLVERKHREHDRGTARHGQNNASNRLTVDMRMSPTMPNSMGNEWESPTKHNMVSLDDLEEDLVHAKSDRKILTSAVKSKSKQRGEVERASSSNPRSSSKQDQRIGSRVASDENTLLDMGNKRPDSRSSAPLETRETQTNLNHSFRSVQSNVPYYEAGKTVLDESYRESNARLSRQTTCKQQENLGRVEDDLTPGKVNTDKQTNVGDFLGNSSTPEKEKLKYSHKEVDKDLEHLRTKLSWLMDGNEAQQQSHTRSKSGTRILHKKDVFIQEESNKSTDRRRRRSGNLAELLLADGDGKPNQAGKKVKLKSNGFSDFLLGDTGIGNEKVSNHVDEKVREWIKTQPVVNGNYSLNPRRNKQTVMIEETSFHINIKSDSPVANSNHSAFPNDNAADSSSDSCDKFPVKLEKVESRNTRTSTPHKLMKRDLTGARSAGRIYKSADLGSFHGNIKEVPTRDVQGTGMSAGRWLPESDSTDTESSILSLPFSVRSGESVSSTIQAVKLLRKLYHVDPDTRQNLVLMARCFRRWLNNVLYAKARNLQITAAAQRISPISYDVMIRKGDICYKTSQLACYFTKWRDHLQEVQLTRAIEALQRKHLLQKGLNAFKWAINRSKLQQGILQDRISGILLASSFRKWQFRTIENRRLRMHQAFLRWRQFTKEAQKMRTLRNQTNMNLKQKLFGEWCDRYKTRVKQHRADGNYRTILLSHSWISWKWFTVLNKEKKERQSLAIQMFRSTLQKKMFVQMTVEFSKYKKAKDKYRISQLKIAIRAWRVGAELSRGEREDNARVAEVCWVRTSVRTTFTKWRDALLTKRAVRMSNAVITKKTFTLWNDRYRFLIQRRESVDQFVRKKVQSKAFEHWSVFVSVMRRRREAAIECLQAVLQRRVLQTWSWYTKYQRDLRRRHQLYVRKTQMESQRKYLDLWRSRFKVKCDEQRAQQFWSNTCAKKAADHWLMVCHRRKLVRVLQETEPLRQLTTQRVFFMKWLSRLQQIEDEKQEAGEVRLVLNHSLLRSCFDKWHESSQKLLLIKPMVLRYRHTLVTQCFQKWRHYVKHKAMCCHSYQEVIKLRLKQKFAAWRRQYTVHQIEKEFNTKLIRRQSARCLQAWQAVIKRKHMAKTFHEHHLQKSAFYYWNMLAVQQLRQKTLQHIEQESVTRTMREYFDRWRDRMLRVQSMAENGIEHLQKVQENNQLRSLFTFWRRHFRATLIARENEKIRTRKLAKQAIQEWHRCTQNSLEDAVQRFAAAIGLDIERGGATNLGGGHHSLGGGDVCELGDGNDSLAIGEADQQFEDKVEPLNLDFVELGEFVQSPRTPGRTSRTPRTPRTPKTPKPGSSYGTPLRRLFSPSRNGHSLTQSQDFDAVPLLSSTFLDARFEMEQAVKTESRREIVVTAVTRLRHWPLSNLFDQWKDFTARQLEFKHLTTQMKSVQEKLGLSLFFKSWVMHYRNTQIAKQHYDMTIQHKALLNLVLYRNSRKEKTHLKMVANQHYARNVFTALFPIWLQKTQEKQHTEHILHLWDNVTAEEQQLIPRERSFKYKQNRKLLTSYFTTWQTKFRKIDKLKRVYHKIIMERYFVTWHKWALEKHRQRIRCEEFRDRRIKSLVFKKWCLRHKQKTEVARKYHDTWHNYQGRIFKAWLIWAKDQRKHKALACQVVETRNKHLLTQMFTVWKASADKQMETQKWFDVRLSQRTLQAWHEVTVWQKDLRNRMLQCRLMSYKILARQALQHWYNSYCHRLENRKLHNLIVEKRILRIATTWRRKAQKTRGAWLKQKLEQRLVQRNLEKWKHAMTRNQDRVVVLEKYVATKNVTLIAQCLGTWRTELKALQAQRVFNMRLMVTYMENWKITAKGCKERRKALQAHEAKKQGHTQRVFFLYWYNVSMARKSIRGHANLKMQLAVFKAWLLYTRKQINLRRLETTLIRKKNQKTLVKYWYMMKTRFHYCAELTDIANGVIREKNNKLMQLALSHWDFRLKIVIADEFYQHLLAKRAATRWFTFVCNRKQERERMEKLLKKATEFHNRKLCKKVYSALQNEVQATRHNNKRLGRLGEKYGRLWKYRVDLAYTALCVRKENLYLTTWKKWHLEFVKRKAEHKVVAFEKKQKLSMIFISWRNLCRKKARRSSMIPLPVSPAITMPSAIRSSNSTPTDEVFSPPPVLVKPTQIPLPNMSANRNKMAVTNGRSTPTGSTGRSTPTGLAGRSTSSYTGRKHSSAS